MTHSTIVALNDRLQPGSLRLSMCLECGQVFDRSELPSMEIDQESKPQPGPLGQVAWSQTP